MRSQKTIFSHIRTKNGYYSILYQVSNIFHLFEWYFFSWFFETHHKNHIAQWLKNHKNHNAQISNGYFFKIIFISNALINTFQIDHLCSIWNVQNQSNSNGDERQMNAETYLFLRQTVILLVRTHTHIVCVKVLYIGTRQFWDPPKMVFTTKSPRNTMNSVSERFSECVEYTTRCTLWTKAVSLVKKPIFPLNQSNKNRWNFSSGSEYSICLKDISSVDFSSVCTICGVAWCINIFNIFL